MKITIQRAKTVEVGYVNITEKSGSHFDVPSHENQREELSREDAMAFLLTPEEWACVRNGLNEMYWSRTLNKNAPVPSHIQCEIDTIEIVLKKTE